MEKPKKERLITRWGVLKSERSAFFTSWQEISTYLLPYQGRYFIQDHNRGKRVNSIYDSTGTRALRVLGAGMMAGATSPARPWFRLLTSNQDLNKYLPVKVWLAEATSLMQLIFQKSNTYRALHQIYEEIGSFATGASIVLSDFKNVIHHYTLTAGEYCIAANYKGDIDTLYREFERPVGQIVKEFGRDNCSLSIKNLYDRGDLDTWMPLMHVIEPREDRDITKKDNKNMPWASYYFEPVGDDTKFLRESGFRHFPGLVPRWSVAGGDTYGNGPGMEALGDIKQLQHEQLRKAQGIDYQSNPPLQVPSNLKNNPIDRLPGGTTYFDSASPQAGIRNLFEVNLSLDHLLADIQDVRDRIRGCFYADLFLMLANATDTRMTATEVAERHEEKLLMLGPVLERLHNELLSPLIEITFSHMVTAGILPPPPDELRGIEINVEFVSMLAQAQRAIGINSVDRWIANIGAVSQYKPEVIDRLDADYWVEASADMLGVDPRMIVPQEDADAIRQQRAQIQQQAQQAALAEQSSKTTRNLATSPTTGENALTNVIDMFSGYNTPQQGG